MAGGGQSRLRLWRVGTWREEAEYTGQIGCFSPDGRVTAVVEPTRIIRLVNFATGRTLARLESPELGGINDLTFSPDGSRLVLNNRDRPAPSVRVWDLRAIRKDLAGMGLDWQAPAYPEPDPAAATGPLEVAVNLGAYRGLDEEAWSLLRQAGELEGAGQIGEAIAVYRRVADRSPASPWPTTPWPGCWRRQRRRIAGATRPSRTPTAPGSGAPTSRCISTPWASPSTARAGSPRRSPSWSGAWRPASATSTASTSSSWRWRTTGSVTARRRQCLERAMSWISGRTFFSADYVRELRMFRDEAQALVAGELPDDVFAAPR